MTDFNWIDKAIAYVSPVRAVQRAQARNLMNSLLAYDAGKTGRRNDGWIEAVSSSPDGDIMRTHTIIRDRARSLEQNNPHATKAINVLVANKVGTGILTSAAEEKVQGKRPNFRKNEKLNARWERFVDTCDVTGKLDLYGIQSQVERTRIVSGDCLIRFISTPLTRGGVATKLQVLEPDYIDVSKNHRISDTVQVRYGIEYDGLVPVAYHIFKQHPSDTGPLSMRRGNNTDRIPAADIIHYYKPLRPGQSRGITDLANVMLRLRRLDDYDDAEVMRKNIAACLAAFVTSPAGMPATTVGPVATDESGSRIEKFRPGMIHYPPTGSSVTVADPKPSDGYREFMTVQLHAIAAGLGIPYELLTTDLVEVNYTSHRGGLIQFKGIIEADQWQLLVPQFCRPVWQRIAREAALFDSTINPETPATFTPPRFGLLDPAKEIPAMIEAMQAGISTFQQTVRGQGYEWEAQLDEIETFQRECKSRKLLITAIPPEKPEPVTKPVPETTPKEEAA